MKKIVILDDMKECHDVIRKALSGKYTIISTYTPKDAYEKIMQENPDLAIVDVNLDISNPKLTQGLNLIERISGESLIPLFCVSKRNYAKEAKKAGAREFRFKKEFYENIALYVEKYLENGK